MSVKVVFTHTPLSPPPTPPPPSVTRREGLVSREEITAYFMRASVICSKLGLGFVHNFQETTYMKPTFCDNCSGFVSPRTHAHTLALALRDITL